MFFYFFSTTTKRQLNNKICVLIIRIMSCNNLTSCFVMKQVTKQKMNNKHKANYNCHSYNYLSQTCEVTSGVGMVLYK